MSYAFTQALEDKLINIKNIVIKHSESSDFSGRIFQMKFLFFHTISFS